MDTNVANEVQEAIESYHLPRGVKAPGAGNTSRTLGKCFRDEDELAAASSLPESIRSALEKSRKLIVICTPETPRSVWIEREIIAFSELHGCENIFAVLADGSSKESIPESLRERVVLDVDGNPQVIPAEPLAADFRFSKAKKRPEEKLRVIAAIAGCGFDDLRQRERERKRQRMMKRIAIVASLTIVIAVLGVFGFKSFRQSQAEESLRLAFESQTYLALGDRYGAIELALRALPFSSAAIDRPFVEEAKEALEAALQIDPTTSLWLPNYMVNDEDYITQIAVSPDEGWVATMDEARDITVRDVVTGSVLSRCNLPLTAASSAGNDEADEEAEEWKLEVAGSTLIAAERAGSGLVACFEARTGDLLWYEREKRIDAIAVTPDNKVLLIMQCYDDSTDVSRRGLSTGAPMRGCSFESPDLSSFDEFLPAVAGEYTDVLYVGAGNMVFRFDCSSREMTTHNVGDGMTVYSMKAGYTKKSETELDCTILTASASDFGHDPDASDYLKSAVRFDAFDTSMRSRWNYETVYNLSLVGQAYGAVRANDRPVIHERSMMGTPSYLFSAGTTLLKISLDGQLLYSEDFGSPISSVGVGYYNDGSDVIYAVLANGDVKCRIPDSNVVTSGLEYRLPMYVRRSYVGWVGDQAYVTLAQPMQLPTRMVSYRMATDLASADDEHQEHSLDELIAQAHELLDSIAQ